MAGGRGIWVKGRAFESNICHGERKHPQSGANIQNFRQIPLWMTGGTEKGPDIIHPSCIIALSRWERFDLGKGFPYPLDSLVGGLDVIPFVELLFREAEISEMVAAAGAFQIAAEILAFGKNIKGHLAFRAFPVNVSIS